MAQAREMTVAAWGVIGGGVLTGKYNHTTDEPRRYDGASERARQVAESIGTVAAEIARTPAQVAINWVRQRGRNIIPIVGARTAAQMAGKPGGAGLRTRARTGATSRSSRAD